MIELAAQANSVRLGNYHYFFFVLERMGKILSNMGVGKLCRWDTLRHEKKARTKNSVLVYNSLVYNGYILRQIRGTD